MKKIVITELPLIVKLSKFGILKYFNNDELNFYMTDFCYDHQTFNFNNDKTYAKKLIEDGLLKVVGLDEFQMQRLHVIHKKYKPAFIVKTISALVLAIDMKCKLLSEDENLRDSVSKDFNIKSYGKEHFVDDLIYEINMMGRRIDADLIKFII